MAKLIYVADRLRRTASKLLAFLVPNSFHLKLRIRCIRSMYRLFDFRAQSDKKRFICYYKSGSPDCPGLADRLKALVTGYVLATENGYPFYIYHDLGFQLRDYLLPAEVDWSLEESSISLGLNRISCIWFAAEMLNLNPRVKEYHLHCAGDITENLEGELKDKYDFGRTFHKLFRPSPHLSQLLEKARHECGIAENEYIAVHIRFLDFFETVESTRDTAFTRHATPEEQAAMIESIHRTVEQIHEQCGGRPIVLFSDSTTFLAAKHPSYVRILPGQVGHIYVHADNQSVIDKAFTDMFIIAGAAHVYNIVGPGTYKSGYSYMGARIGCKPFTRYERLM